MVLIVVAANGRVKVPDVNVMTSGASKRRPPMIRWPWLTNDPLTPNEAYFKNVDAVLHMAGDDNLIVLITIYPKMSAPSRGLSTAR